MQQGCALHQWPDALQVHRSAWDQREQGRALQFPGHCLGISLDSCDLSSSTGFSFGALSFSGTGGGTGDCLAASWDPLPWGFLRLFSAGVGARLGVLLGSFVWGRGGMRCTPHFRKVMALRSGGLLVANGVLQLGLLESILRSRSGQLIM